SAARTSCASKNAVESLRGRDRDLLGVGCANVLRLNLLGVRCADFLRSEAQRICALRNPAAQDRGLALLRDPRSSSTAFVTGEADRAKCYRLRSVERRRGCGQAIEFTRRPLRGHPAIAPILCALLATFVAAEARADPQGTAGLTIGVAGTGLDRKLWDE